MRKTCNRYIEIKIAGLILESKSMHVIFQKKGKIFENLGKNVRNLKIF